MPKFNDLSGKRFGRLLVTDIYERRPKKRGNRVSTRLFWKCNCDCGNQLFIAADCIVSGTSKSCGCLRKEMTAARRTSHGRTGSRTYRIWQRIKQRCYYSGTLRYERWGGRGITMCKSWRDSFEQFVADMGEVPPGKSIDRIDNDGPYCKTNCRWASPREQALNSTHTRWLTLNGVSHPLTIWSEITGLHRTTITQRLDTYGWTVEKTLTTECRQRTN